MFTMTFPPIADNTVTSAPCTKPIMQTIICIAQS